MADLDNKLKIFMYMDYREYLTAYYAKRKASERGYSYAVFSRAAGIQSPNYLKLVMDGTRGLTPQNTLRFAKALSLTPTETEYWENLVAFNQAKAAEQKRHYLMRLAQVTPPRDDEEGAARVREIRDEWAYFSSWHHAAIRELLLFPAFEEDPTWIAKKLRRRLTIEEARHSLQLLERLGFAGRDEKGRLRQSEREVRYLSLHNHRNHIIQNYHVSTARLALESIETDPVERRDFSGLMIGVRKEDFARLRARLTEFRQQINQEFSSVTAADQVVQINFQVIPVTDPSRD